MSNELHMTTEQTAALEGMIGFGREWEVAALEGVAGSGKTFTINRFLHTVVENNRVAVACPTWKALSVIERVDGVEYMTVHSLLGLRLKQLPGGKTKCLHEGECKLYKFDLVIVDEASMIGGELFSVLIDPLSRQGAAVLFVGDPHQLPPVEDESDGESGGLSPVFQVVNTRWRLNQVVRQAADNPIIQASAVVRRYIESGERISMAVLGDSMAGNGGDKKRLAGAVAGGIDAIVHFAVDRLATRDDVRVLCYTNARVARINAEIHRRIYGSDDTETAGFAAGERVIMQEEFRIKGGPTLRNSEELIVQAVEPAGELLGRPSALLHLDTPQYGTLAIPIPLDRRAMDRYVTQLFRAWRTGKHGSKHAQDVGEASNRHAWNLLNNFANVRHAYASTIHKAQGSTYDTVIVDWVDVTRMGRDFNRAVYVAITRPRARLAVVG